MSLAGKRAMKLERRRLFLKYMDQHSTSVVSNVALSKRFKASEKDISTWKKEWEIKKAKKDKTNE